MHIFPKMLNFQHVMIALKRSCTTTVQGNSTIMDYTSTTVVHEKPCAVNKLYTGAFCSYSTILNGYLRMWLEFCSTILKVTPYRSDFIEKALCGMQRSEKVSRTGRDFLRVFPYWLSLSSV